MSNECKVGEERVKVWVISMTKSDENEAPEGVQIVVRLVASQQAKKTRWLKSEGIKHVVRSPES